MQGLLQAVRSCREKLRLAVLGQSQARNAGQFKGSKDIAVMESPRMQLKGLENTTVSDVLMTKGGEKAGSWLCCRMDDTVYDAVKQMAQNNIGSLVVLKPGDHHQIAGIITERDYLRKVIVQDRASKYTRVGDIMTDQSKLITVAPDTNILQAMQIMTGNCNNYIHMHGERRPMDKLVCKCRKRENKKEPNKACPSDRRKDCGCGLSCGYCPSSSGAAERRS